MQTLYTTTAMALMLGLATTAYAAGAKTERQSGAQQTAQSQQQQPKQSQTAGQTQRQMQALGVVDTNNDGQISAEEAQAHRERIFSALDVDRSRALSRQETGGMVAVEPGYVVVTRMIPVVATTDIGSRMLSEMDKDQDRQISRQEYMQYGEQQFKQAQERAGGQLTTGGQTGQTQTGQTQTGQAQTGQAQTRGWQEIVRWRESRVDRNDDGMISEDEAASAWSETFNQLDSNGNNQLSQDELAQVQEQMAMVDQRFAKLDSDGDGQISKEEFTSAGENLMELADFNQNGQVSAWEYRAVRFTNR